MIKHKHHIIPKHSGGSNDPSNIVELTIEEHAEAHKKLWEQYGKKEDWLAWQGLTGMIGKDEIIKELYKIVGSKNGNYTRKEKKGIFNQKYLNSKERLDNCSKGGKVSGEKNKNSGLLKTISSLGHVAYIEKYNGGLTNEKRKVLGLPLINPLNKLSEQEKQQEIIRLGKISSNRKGSSWYYNPNNTKEQRMINTQEKIPDGWIKGRFIDKNKGKTFWYNPNLNIEKFQIESPGEGFIKGRNPKYAQGNINNLKQYKK